VIEDISYGVVKNVVKPSAKPLPAWSVGLARKAAVDHPARRKSVAIVGMPGTMPSGAPSESSWTAGTRPVRREATEGIVQEAGA
jgi:hypothetical protein